MNICQNMNMIFKAIDSVEMDFLVSNNTGYIGIKLFSLSGTNGFFYRSLFLLHYDTATDGNLTYHKV